MVYLGYLIIIPYVNNVDCKLNASSLTSRINFVWISSYWNERDKKIGV